MDIEKPKNLGGRPTGKKARDKFYLASLAREDTEDAYNLIASLMRDTTAKMADRLKAAELCLDRGWGKAPIEINLGTQEQGVKFIFEVREFNALAPPAKQLAPPAVTEAIAHELTTTATRGQS